MGAPVKSAGCRGQAGRKALSPGCVLILHFLVARAPVLGNSLGGGGWSPGPGESSLLPFQTGDPPGPRIPLNVIL